MATSKTALAAAAFGVVAMVVSAGADEAKINFTSELQNREIAADSRQGGERSVGVPSTHPGDKTAKSSRDQFKRWWEVDFVDFRSPNDRSTAGTETEAVPMIG